LREWYKGSGEELYKQYTIYVIFYNKDTKAFSSKNIIKYSYMQKGIEDLISLVDKTVLETNENLVYLFSIKEGSTIYCSEGPIALSKNCRKMLGFALFTGK